MAGIRPDWRNEMQDQKPILFQLRDATLACRKRNNDPRIATHVENGLLQVHLSVRRPGKSTYDIVPLSGWIRIDEAIKFLNEYAA